MTKASDLALCHINYIKKTGTDNNEQSPGTTIQYTPHGRQLGRLIIRHHKQEDHTNI